MPENKLNLLQDFPAVSTETWMEAVNRDLKGADFEKKLVWRTNEGFNINPFYRYEDIEDNKMLDVQPATFPYIRSTKPNNEWYIRQNIEVKDPAEANKKALDILQKGITSLGFHIRKDDLNAQFVATLLKDIDPRAVELNFATCIAKSAELATLLTDYFKQNGFYDDPQQLVGSIDVDPFNKMLLKGKIIPKEHIQKRLAETVHAAEGLPFYRVIEVNAVSLNNAGATASQELGYALAWGNEYLSLMIDAGVDKSLAAKKIKFNFGVGNNYFMEIAKFRAARVLWAEIVAAYKPECHRECPNNQPDGICRCATKIRMHAETSRFNMTAYDPNVNMLRTQTEAMSATLGGIDSLTVLPYDVALKPSDEFSERIARNQQLLLKEESHFDKIIDPAAGSYYIENLTKELAMQAWKLFLEIEEKEGFYQTILSEFVQKTINETAQNRLKSVSSRREILLGTNQYPNLQENISQKITNKNGQCNCGCSGGNHHDEPKLEKISTRRAAEEFEALRLATEKSEKTPVVFLLTIGNLAMRLARAQFSSNFFGVAGYKIIDNLGFKNVADGVQAAKAANADVVVLCSSDDEYSEFATQALEQLKGSATLVVAGAPACMDELKEKGVEYFIHVRSNVLHTLQNFNKILLTQN